MSEATTTPDLTLTRTLDAPRSLVFEAFAKEEHLLKWFGPRSYPVTSWSHDFRAGGSFEYVMEGPGGIQAPGSGEYTEIVEGERIVARSRIVNDGEVIFEVSQVYSFADAPGGGTDFTLESYVLLNKDFPGLAGMEQGWQETLDRLVEHLAAVS
jgi:uncharacterized protein YndB with AHSA1/START domain